MKILIRAFYIFHYKFCITFLGHLYLWKHGKKSQMKINQLIKYEHNFNEESHKILPYQWLQVFYYFSKVTSTYGNTTKNLKWKLTTFVFHLYIWEHGKKSQMNISKLTIYYKNFCKYSEKNLLYQWLQVLRYISRSSLPMGIRKKILSKN